MHETLSLTLLVKQRDVPAKDDPEILEWKEKVCRVNNKPVDFVKYVHDEFVREMVQADLKENPKYAVHSNHIVPLRCRVTFESGEFFVGDCEIEQMDVIANCLVEVRQKKIISKFELKGHGRCFSFEPLEDWIPGKTVEAVMVERFR